MKIPLFTSLKNYGLIMFDTVLTCVPHWAYQYTTFLFTACGVYEHPANHRRGLCIYSNCQCRLLFALLLDVWGKPCADDNALCRRQLHSSGAKIFGPKLAAAASKCVNKNRYLSKKVLLEKDKHYGSSWQNKILKQHKTT